MKTAAILALLVTASPAIAQGAAPAPAPQADQKPFIFDSAVGLKSFTAPEPVTVLVPGDPEPKAQAPYPKMDLRTRPVPPEKPAPELPKKGLG
jgi:hypothetical protein